MAAATKSSGKMTVFKSDRHEDFAAIVFVTIVVAAMMIYMAYFSGKVDIKAPADGKILTIDVAGGAHVKEGDKLFTYEAKVKKYVKGELVEETKTSTYKAKVGGMVLEVKANPGDAIKKDSTKVVVFEHDKGTLP